MEGMAELYWQTGRNARIRDSESGEVPILSAADTEYHRAMSHLLPLSRVAKLVGQPRHALQEMIRGGVLATFDGMVELDELLRVFPDVKWDDDAEFRRVQEIKDKAFAKRVLERALPDKDVLVARLNALGNDYAAARALLLHYGNVMTWLDEKIDEIEEAKARKRAMPCIPCARFCCAIWPRFRRMRCRRRRRLRRKGYPKSCQPM
jgi:hypothetical protein